MFNRLAAIIAFTIALALALAVTPSLADQYSCETVDQSAVAYVNTNVPVSKIETDRQCALAIDGATRTGRQADAFANGIDNLTYQLFEGGGDLDGGTLVNVIAGAFIGGDGANDSPVDEELAASMNEAMGGEEIDILNECFRRFTESVGPQYSFDSVAWFDPIDSGRISCELIPPKGEEIPDGPRPVASFGTLAIRFILDERQISLFLPAELMRDARDNNYE